ncbi:MAG: hypothetical protein HFG80_04690 [Eubacterium sp.]|nr:hypothetical protein [Eubacterium sp.]
MVQTQQGIARELLELSKSRILMQFRFLSPAVSGMQMKESEEVTFACDGNRFYYSPKAVIEAFKNEKNFLSRMFLHCTFHCMLQHMYAKERYQGKYWDLACDIAVEQMAMEMKSPYLELHSDPAKRAALEKIKEEMPALTAEVIFYHWKKHPPAEADLCALKSLFAMDGHGGWSVRKQQTEELPEQQEADSDFGNVSDVEMEAQKKEWKKISQRVLTELEHFSDVSDCEMETVFLNLRMITRQKYDYRRFLTKFFTAGETLRINQEEFDYIFYTYGLRLYGNVPLVEELEYKEEKRIREFAIVIDTSASVKGEAVRAFLRHTYQILQQSENFFSKINLHLIQCDSEVREDKKIEDREQFEDYLWTMQIKGFGSTDFRSAFDFIGQLCSGGEFKNLKGILYFTDGEGVYPVKQPQFDTAFVFLEQEGKEPDVPPWAMKIVLDEKQLEEWDGQK